MNIVQHLTEIVAALDSLLRKYAPAQSFRTLDAPQLAVALDLHRWSEQLQSSYGILGGKKESEL